MIATSHQLQIARSGSPSSRCLSIGGPALSSRPGRAATINHPERPWSLPAGRRSLMGGCAAWRQTRAQGRTRVLHKNRAIRPSRLFQHQTDSHSRAGQARWGRCDYRPAVGRTGRRFAGLGCVHSGLHRVAFPSLFVVDLTLGRGLGSGPFGQFDGIGRRSTALQASFIQSRRQGRFQRFAKGQPRHFQNLRFNAVETSDGARGSVPIHTGEIPQQQGERHHVRND